MEENGARRCRGGKCDENTTGPSPRSGVTPYQSAVGTRDTAALRVKKNYKLISAQRLQEAVNSRLSAARGDQRSQVQ